MSKMRAGLVVERGRVVCDEVEIRKPGQGELLVRTDMAAICGSDLHVVYDGLGVTEYPLRPGFPGHEGVGEVVESNDAGWKPGDKVLCCPYNPNSATFADYQTIPAHSCVKLPASERPLEELLMAQQMGTTLFALRRFPRDLHGKTVMVMGQGSAGVFFAYFCKRMGAGKVIVSDKSEARLAMSHDVGADVAVQADAAGENVRAAVMEHTNEQGVDFLVEAVGRQDSLLQSVGLMREGGEMLLFGLPDTSEPVSFNFHDFFRKRLHAYSTYGTQFEPDLTSFRYALELIAQGDVDVSQLVTHRLPIERLDEAMRLANDRSDGARKVTVTFNGNR